VIERQQDVAGAPDSGARWRCACANEVMPTGRICRVQESKGESKLDVFVTISARCAVSGQPLFAAKKNFAAAPSCCAFPEDILVQGFVSHGDIRTAISASTAHSMACANAPSEERASVIINANGKRRTMSHRCGC